MRLLVLWDVDYTLLAADGVGRRMYEHALEQMYGVRLSQWGESFAGRTDSAIALELLELAGVPDPEGELRPFHAFMAARADEIAGEVRAHGRTMPGAAEAVAAIAFARPPGQIVQSLLTGNLPELAKVKVTTLGLAEHLDLSLGAYGDVSPVRADLVGVARRNAADKYGGEFAGRSTILVGDTPGDIAAALVTGATAVAVATGSFTAAELAAAGAHLVLPDLSDTAAATTAILDAAAG